MCTDCFTEEINSFASTYPAAKEAWKVFKPLLAQKLEIGQLKWVKVEKGMDYVRSEYIWEIFACKSCGQKWTLFEPFVNNEGTKYTGSFTRYKPNLWEKFKAGLLRLVSPKAML